jgi:hypothetical protein
VADREDDREDGTPAGAKATILARRARFVRAAVATMVAGGALGACGKAQPCLEPPPRFDAGDDATPEPCLSPLPPDAADAEPQPCLEPAIPDDGSNGSDADAEDGGPMPCLSPPPN